MEDHTRSWNYIGRALKKLYLKQLTSMVSTAIATVMRRIRKAYNDREDKQAALEKREAKSMPPIHPHVFRHTCCTRLCEVESNPARVKEIMGHSSINITLKVYAEISREAKQEAVRKVESKFGALYKKAM